VLAVRELYTAGPCHNEREGKKMVVRAVKSVAGMLGNRAATCRKYYIHPAIFDAYLTGSLFPIIEQGEQQDTAYAGLGLRPEEYGVMVIIAAHQERLAREVRSKAA
jgi:DNA topoisomerase I